MKQRSSLFSRLASWLYHCNKCLKAQLFDFWLFVLSTPTPGSSALSLQLRWASDVKMLMTRHRSFFLSTVNDFMIDCDSKMKSFMGKLDRLFYKLLHSNASWIYNPLCHCTWTWRHCLIKNGISNIRRLVSWWVWKASRNVFTVETLSDKTMFPCKGKLIMVKGTF